MSIIRYNRIYLSNDFKLMFPKFKIKSDRDLDDLNSSYYGNTKLFLVYIKTNIHNNKVFKNLIIDVNNFNTRTVCIDVVGECIFNTLLKYRDTEDKNVIINSINYLAKNNFNKKLYIDYISNKLNLVSRISEKNKISKLVEDNFISEAVNKFTIDLINKKLGVK